MRIKNIYMHVLTFMPLLANLLKTVTKYNLSSSESSISLSESADVKSHLASVEQTGEGEA
ncbi:hypothetical protein V6Z12_A13G245700 [Gossypium hirsutum]